MKDKLLPTGWAMSPIGNLCTLNNGRAFKPTEWSDKGLPIVRIQNLNKETATFNYFEGDFEEKYHLKGGELLFAWSGTPGTSFGAHVWRGGEAVLNQHIFRIDFDKSFFEKRFFRHAIDQTLDELIGGAHGGVGLRHVTKGKFENTKISVPPFAEQKRIADKLDTVLARVDACRERLNRVPLILKRFRQSVLAAATSGKLTADWRGKSVDWVDEGNPTIANDEKSWISQAQPNQCSNEIFCWKKIRLSECADSRLGKMLDKTKNQGVPTEYLRNVNVRWFAIDLSDLQEIKVSENEIQEFSIMNGDVLICEGGEPGRCAVWNKGENRLVFQKALHRVRTNKNLLPLWLCFNLKNDADKGLLEDYFTGTTIKHFTGKSLSKYEFLLPPIEEQHEIVRRVETLFTFADRLEARLTTARTATDRLTPALLAKAFRGELVPQDPNDEPAAELLKRLAAARTATSDKPRRGRAAKVEKRPSDHPSPACDS